MQILELGIDENIVYQPTTVCSEMSLGKCEKARCFEAGQGVGK